MSSVATITALDPIGDAPACPARHAMARFCAGLVALAAVTTAVTLAMCATAVPLLLGWHSVSISSGSMEPSLGVGDVVLVEPYRGQDLGPGMVVVFEHQDHRGLVSHRIDSVNEDGTLTTRGDANGRADSTPIDAGEVVGFGRAVVPMIGMPAVWLGSGDIVVFALALLAWFALLYVARWGVLRRFDPSRRNPPAGADSDSGDRGSTGPPGPTLVAPWGPPAAASIGPWPAPSIEDLGEPRPTSWPAPDRASSARRSTPVRLRPNATSHRKAVLEPVEDRPRRRGVLLLYGACTAAVWAVLAATPVSLATFTSASSNPGNNIVAATLLPPSNLQLSSPCPPPVAIAYRARSTAIGSGVAITLAKPAGTVTSDMMLTHVVLRDDVALVAPTGWSLVRRSTAGPFSALYVKTAGAAEPASYTWTAASSVRFAAGMGTWANVSTVSPIGAHAGASATGNSIVAPSVTTSGPDTMLVTFWSIRDDKGVIIPVAMTKRWEAATAEAGAAGHQVQTTAGTEPFVGPGPSGTRTAVSPANENNVGQTVALRRATADASVSATWTATPSTIATGYKLQRWLGAVQQSEQTITPRTTTNATDAAVTNGVNYTYRLFAYRSSWTSTVVSNTITVSNC